jgi:imidazolonepropionase-like amidohydrolase
VASFLFTGGRFLDPRRDELAEGIEVLVEDGLIKEVSEHPIRVADAMRVAIGDRTLMPGLIDAHIHIVLTEVNLRLLDEVPLTLLSAKGSVAIRAMLLRGFTTLRDTGGGRLGDEGGGRAGAVRGTAPVHRRPARSARPGAMPATGSARRAGAAVPAAMA